MRGAPCFLEDHARQMVQIEAQKLAGRQILSNQNRRFIQHQRITRSSFRPGDVQQLFADITDIADTLAQIIATGGRQLVAHQLHIGNDCRP